MNPSLRILITGANGFVGHHLIDHLLATEPNAHIAAMTHGGEMRADNARLHSIPGDIMDEDGLREVLHSERPDHIYHLAGAASGAGSDRDSIFALNVEGTRRLMSAISSETPLARTLFTSTGYVYGDCDLERPATEIDPLRPIGLYAESKRAAEPYARSGRAIIARSFNHTGPGQAPAFAVPAFAAQIAAIERGEQAPLLRVGNLEAMRDFLDVRDVVRAYSLLLAKGEPGQTYNVCSGQAHSMQSLLVQLLSLSDASISVEADPARLRPSDISISIGSPTRLKTATGWSPEISLHTTLTDTLGWFR